MRKIGSGILLTVLLLAFLSAACTQKTDKMDWWKEAKFGMFIHWGLYAVPAGIYNGKEAEGVGEWIMFNESIPVAEYEKYADEFNPVKFNASQWVAAAKDAGMKYIVITSKHHDGFCLWDSKTSDYDIVEKTPYKKDILKQLAEECQKQNIKLCFYYSIWDWHHPKENIEQIDEYFNEYLKPQIKELLTEYGDIGIMWFDGEWVDEWTEEKGIELYNYILSIQPNAIVNNRVGKARSGMDGISAEKSFAADYDTPEQEIPATLLSDRSWETCMTMNYTWGYKSTDHEWKSTEKLINNLVDIVAKGGNFLLNVGPKANGTFPAESIDRLKTIGNWMKINSEAIYGTKPYRKYKEGESTRYTSSADGKYLYAIVTEYEGNKIELDEINIKKDSRIKLLGYESEIEYKLEAEKLTIDCPTNLYADTTLNKYRVLRIEQSEFVADPEIVVKREGNEIAVNIIPKSGNTIIKYTLDGSVPSLKSTTFTEPLKFNTPELLKVKSFKEGFSSGLTLTKIIDLPIEGIHGLSYKYFEGSNWTRLPDFSKLVPVKDSLAANIDISRIKYREDQFALQFNSNLNISKSGYYTFYLDSDDGSKLIVDSKVLIDNDGSHSRTRKEAGIYLEKGMHDFELQYFDDCEGEYLDLSFASDEIPKQNIPASFFYLKK